MDAEQSRPRPPTATRILTLPSRAAPFAQRPKPVNRTLTGPSAKQDDAHLSEKRPIAISRGIRRAPLLARPRLAPANLLSRPSSSSDQDSQGHTRHNSLTGKTSIAELVSALIPPLCHRRYATRGSATSEGSTIVSQKLPGHFPNENARVPVPIKLPPLEAGVTHRSQPSSPCAPAVRVFPLSPRAATVIPPKKVCVRNSSACLLTEVGKRRNWSVTPRPKVLDQLVPSPCTRMRSHSDNIVLCDSAPERARPVDPVNFNLSGTFSGLDSSRSKASGLSLNSLSSSRSSNDEDRTATSSDEGLVGIPSAVHVRSIVPKLQLPVGLPSAFNLRGVDLSASSFSHSLSPSSPAAGRFRIGGSRVVRRVLDACTQRPRRLQRSASIGLPVTSTDLAGTGIRSFCGTSAEITSRQSSSWTLHEYFMSLTNHISAMRVTCVLTSRLCATLLVAWMKERGVRGLALDFDNTLSRMHSHGYVDLDTVKRRFWESMAPDAALLCEEAYREGLKLSCLTFSDTAAIERRSDTCIAGRELIEKFVERSGYSFRFDYVMGYYPRLHGAVGMVSKNEHLERFAAEFGFSRSEILFIDDDVHNVKEAVRLGHLGLHVKGGHGFSFASMRPLIAKGVQQSPHVAP